MSTRKLGTILFSTVYPLYVQKAERKGRTRKEVDLILSWLTGYDPEHLAQQARTNIDFQAFFDQAPALNPHRLLIKGVVCGVRVEAIQDPLDRTIRCLDKLVDELAQGKPITRILRG